MEVNVAQLGAAYFPATIPDYPVRQHDGQPVRRGDLRARLPNLAKNVLDFGGSHYAAKPTTNPPEVRLKRVTLREMQSAFQCAPSEPDLSPALSMLRMAPPTMRTLEWVCAYCETRCDHHSCVEEVAMYKQGRYPKLFLGTFNAFEATSLVRIQNNELYVDWCWGRHRTPHYKDINHNGSDLLKLEDHSQFYINEAVLLNLLRIVRFPDTVFLMGGERPFIPWNIPFPATSFAPKLGTGEMPWPWPEMWRPENILHRKMTERANFSDAFIKEFTKQLPWAQRIPKAAFFASYREIRRVVWDQAVLRPEILDVSMTVQEKEWKNLVPWNKNSTEPRDFVPDNKTVDPHRRPGHVSWLWAAHKGKERFYNPGHYKYVVVVGHEGSTTGRLANLLAHSGAVVLLQESAHSYHFSARLQKWVHYVPLTHSSADLIEKVEWLRAHDDLAQRIAANARNFGTSYLRLEDYYCYYAAALAVFGEVEKGTGVTAPFPPTPDLTNSSSTPDPSPAPTSDPASVSAPRNVSQPIRPQKVLPPRTPKGRGGPAVKLDYSRK